MYKSFYNLTSDPFSINFVPAFLWLGEKHKEALATLRYGILDNKGFLLLTGEAGTGKTTLINTMTQSFGAEVEWAVINDPKLERIDFYNTIANGFGLEKQFNSKVQFLIQFSHFLHKADDEKKKVVLIVDDCHLLSQEMLEELRLLSNIEKADAKLINIFFVGQPEFKNMLVQPENRAVRQRLTLKSELSVLNSSEAEDYVRHRLKVAGTEEKIFTTKAIQLINKYCQGIAKRIDILCNMVLLAGAKEGAEIIDQKVVATCIRQLNLPSVPSQEDFDNLINMVSDDAEFTENLDTAPMSNPVDFSGFSVKQQSSKGWIKYALGGAFLVVAGLFFWQMQDGKQEISEIVVEVKEEPAEPKAVIQEMAPVSSSPAITVLAANKSEIDQEKAAELKSAILEKAYNGSEDAEEKAVESSSVQQEQEAVGAAESGPAEAQVVGESTIAVEEKEMLAQETVVRSEINDQASASPVEQTMATAGAAQEMEKETEIEVVSELPPLEPRLVRLPLMPNSLNLTRTGMKRLQSFVDRLKLYPRATIMVKGFVSSKTNSPENIKLSEARAKSVQNLLLSKGIDAEQIEVVGMGNKEPLATNDTRQGRAENRRVEIVVISDGS